MIEKFLCTKIRFKTENSDGQHDYVIYGKDVPVNAFWSVTVYDEFGFLLEGTKIMKNLLLLQITINSSMSMFAQ